MKFESGDKRFKFRSVAVIIHNDHVLLHKVVKGDFWALPGGKVEFFEFSHTTLIRELQEELGVAANIIRPLWFVEDFYARNGVKSHEIATYYLTALQDPSAIPFSQDVRGLEQDIDIVFRWVKLADVASLNLWPQFLKERLTALPQEVEFIQINELK
ncbi:NUDIX domain-containing protein [Hahella sp. KA22]|uniref:NUDIX hydrolase n=1 Tax=Hahella sp. KA22 TaxID=1628392 RepID=UPI000FDF07E1|nr:NUDIX hydrolase [Hahella sp. KA22]AZZ92119.1 NUDIX domain-containing protein [Hahella sp. KA22]QAY55490.1 NUDIX domain-containing protein [Hahella sp. KA22]